jgi:hypothetical protein
LHQVAVLFSLVEKTKPWTGLAGALVEHQHLFVVVALKKMSAKRCILEFLSFIPIHLESVDS